MILADTFGDRGRVTVVRLTSTLSDAPLVRITVQPSVQNGLRSLSDVMIDRPLFLPSNKIGLAFGGLDDQAMHKAGEALVDFHDLAVRSIDL